MSSSMLRKVRDFGWLVGCLTWWVGVRVPHASEASDSVVSGSSGHMAGCQRCDSRKHNPE